MRLLATALAAAVLLVAGVLVWVTANGDVGLSWFAATPADGGTEVEFAGDVVLMSTRSLVTGAVLGGLGLVGLGAAGGFRAGRRTRP